MFDIIKAAAAEAATPDDAALEAINALSRRPLAAEEIYTFAVVACDDQPDRDYERFTVDCLAGLLPLFRGKPVLIDHNWSADNQCARIYGGELATDNGATQLRLQCYMLRTEDNSDKIAAIDGGILREVSVGCACKRMTCSICGKPYGECEHRKGREYDGQICIGLISEPADAYELSFVAVPAQPAAGVCKRHERTEHMTTEALERAKARLRIERARL